MKARPRSVENRVAEALNNHFSLLGLTPVERIPVLGRTGPDISINELKLVVDVKSRKANPSRVFLPVKIPFWWDEFCAARLADLDTLWDDRLFPAPIDFHSEMIRGYWKHMEEWTSANVDDGISCVVLHRPEMPIGESIAVIHYTSRRRLIQNARQPNSSIPTE